MKAIFHSKDVQRTCGKKLKTQYPGRESKIVKFECDMSKLENSENQNLTMKT